MLSSVYARYTWDRSTSNGYSERRRTKGYMAANHKLMTLLGLEFVTGGYVMKHAI